MNRNNTARAPRAMIHKRILTIAEDEPDLTMAELANRVSGATTDMVERVLDEYGDPKMKPSKSNFTSKSSIGISYSEERNSKEQLHFDESENEDQPSTLKLLNVKQLETLRKIRMQPDASQRELADELDVTCGTINKRVNSIPGFNWDEREAFVERVLDGEADLEGEYIEESGEGGDTDEETSNLPPAATQFRPLLFDDPDLTSRIVHACMTYDEINENEEIRILQAVMGVDEQSTTISNPGYRASHPP